MTESEAWGTAEVAVLNGEWTRLLVVADRLQELGSETEAHFLRWYALKGNREWRISHAGWPLSREWVCQWWSISDDVNHLGAESKLASLVLRLSEERQRLQEAFSD